MKEKCDTSYVEMYRTFNMGMSYAYVIPEKSVACISKMAKGAKVVGTVVKGPGALLGELEIT